MAKFLMFGHYSKEAIAAISSRRTEKVKDIIIDYGGEVLNIYSLLGETDLVLIVELPDISKAMQASIAMVKATGIQFRTSPAIEVTDFDKLIEE